MTTEVPVVTYVVSAIDLPKACQLLVIMRLEVKRPYSITVGVEVTVLVLMER